MSMQTLNAQALQEMMGMPIYGAAEKDQYLKAAAEKARRQSEALRLFRPIPSQVPFFECRASERLIRGGNRCVAGETEIYDPVAKKYLRLDRIDQPFHVESINPKTGQQEIGQAEIPFLKGVDDLYRVDLSDGSHLICTLGHRVLIDRGWTSVGLIALLLQDSGA